MVLLAVWLWWRELALARLPRCQPAPAAEKARILLVTGMDYPSHLWRQTAPALAEALRQDPRLEVVTVEDPWFLDSPAIDNYDLILLHFQNWQQPGPGELARENLRRVRGRRQRRGAGAFCVRRVVRRVAGVREDWRDGRGPAWARTCGSMIPSEPSASSLPNRTIPSCAAWRTLTHQDELYTCLVGDHPIEVLAQAKSKVDGKYYPMAFVVALWQGADLPLRARPRCQGVECARRCRNSTGAAAPGRPGSRQWHHPPPQPTSK